MKFLASLGYFTGTPTRGYHPTKFLASLGYFAGTPASDRNLLGGTR